MKITPVLLPKDLHILFDLLIGYGWEGAFLSKIVWPCDCGLP
jgi:hypothetical protein